MCDLIVDEVKCRMLSWLQFDEVKWGLELEEFYDEF